MTSKRRSSYPIYWVVFLLCLMVISFHHITAYNVINTSDRVTCQHKNSTELPMYQFNGLTEFNGQDVSIELKVCDKLNNDSYCSNLNMSGWYFISKCTLNKSTMNVRCDLPSELNDLEQGYFRMFIYTNVTLEAVTEKFIYPLREGCFCYDENEYLPEVNQIQIIHNEELKHGVDVKVWRPLHMTAPNSLNVYKYEFHLHRAIDDIVRVLPSKNDDPLDFQIEKLIPCNVYAFQVSIQPKFLNCRFKSGKYYRIQKFTYEPKNCYKRGSFNTTLVFAIAFPVITVGLVVAFIMVKCECATQKKSQRRMYTEQSSLSVTGDAIVRATGHDYDQINVYDTIPTECRVTGSKNGKSGSLVLGAPS